MYHVSVVHAAGGEKLVVRGKGVVAVMVVEGTIIETHEKREGASSLRYIKLENSSLADHSAKAPRPPYPSFFALG